MSTGAAGPVRLGLASVAALAMMTGSLCLAPAAPANGCIWQQHSKPSVKKIKRHGHLRRVKHLKHWWSCDALPAPFEPPAALPAPPATEAPPAEEPQSQVSRLGVKAIEYSYTLSRPEVAAGESIVELNNQGEDPHNLKLQLEGSEEPPLEVPAAATLEQTSAHLTLAPGTYRLYCSLYKHEAKGMEATLVVSGG